MDRYHSSISNKDFMQGLSLSEKGKDSSDEFRDLDQMLSASELNKPWFIKDIDVPTVEIDLKLHNPYPQSANVYNINTFFRYLNDPKIEAEIISNSKLRETNGILQQLPGNSLRDISLVKALISDYYYDLPSPVGGFRSIPSPKDYGVPRWEGKPEDNAKMIRTVAKAIGCSYVGIIDLNDHKLGPIINLFYSEMAVKFEEGIGDYKLQGLNTICYPSNCRYLIVLVPQMKSIYKRFGNFTTLATAGQDSTDKVLHLAKMMNFLHGIGYLGFEIRSPLPPLEILTGIGEYNRTHGPPITPAFGNECLSGTFSILTDLPLAPSKPIDMGILKYCENCLKCAVACPSGAIDKNKLPSWEINTGPWNASNDHKGYKNNSFKCMEFIVNNIATGFRPRLMGHCMNCVYSCPFTKAKMLDSHLKPLPSIVPTLSIDRENTRHFWEIDLPEFGMMSILNTPRMGENNVRDGEVMKHISQ
ncbi:MAG: reductive dehalogenase domain-containing protein [Dehalogenimonas sp.]|uniref:Reductive dehalogenase domain-containing protein n=2 Tax=Dehalococcoidaceae TaxID=1202464 RepID=A0ABZ2J961_9CHLR|nr:reductive dehalogenase domain-containing protein [Dehalogenimonas sp.]